MSHLKDLVEYMAKSLVDYPDKVNISEVEATATSVIELRVAKEDLGKIIGKEGKTAKSIRIILNAASSKLRRRTILNIIEE